jgi:DNA-binding MarR family transcriptional regulator
VLEAISATPDATRTVVARRLGANNKSTRDRIARLVKHGLVVKRQISAHPRRLLYLTPAGREELDRLVEQYGHATLGAIPQAAAKKPVRRRRKKKEPVDPELLLVNSTKKYTGRVREEKKLALMRTLERNGGLTLDNGLKGCLLANLPTIRAFARELEEEGLVQVRESRKTRYKAFVIELTEQGRQWALEHIEHPIPPALIPTTPHKGAETQGRRLELYIMDRCERDPCPANVLVTEASKAMKMEEDKVRLFISLMRSEKILANGDSTLVLTPGGKQRHQLIRQQGRRR